MKRSMMAVVSLAAVMLVVGLALCSSAGAGMTPGPNDWVTAQYTSLGTSAYDLGYRPMAGRAYLNGQTDGNWVPLGRMPLVKDGNGGGPIVQTLEVPVFQTFCLRTDMSVSTYSTHTYDVKTLLGSGYVSTQTKADDLALWFKFFEPTVTAHDTEQDRCPWFKSYVVYGPAFQAGVWEIVHETPGTPYSATTGSFTIAPMIRSDLGYSQAQWAPYMDFSGILAGWLTTLNTAKAGPDPYANLNPVFALAARDGSQPFAIPEPATLALVGLGLGGLLARRRRK